MLGLEALRTEPAASGSSYEDERTRSDDEWRRMVSTFAHEPCTSIGSIGLIAKRDGRTVGLIGLVALYRRVGFRIVETLRARKMSDGRLHDERRMTLAP